MTEPKTIDSIVKLFDSLAARWSDEKEYEDFNDYIEAMKKSLAFLEGAAFVKMTSKPFRVEFTHEGKLKTLRLTRNQIILEELDVPATTPAPKAEPKPATQPERTTAMPANKIPAELNSMTMKQLVDFYNSFRTALPNLPAITTTTYKTKAELITEICNPCMLRPKTIARMLKCDPFQVRQQLRAARAEGALGHVDWKHWNLSMFDFRRVFGKSVKK